MRKRRKGKLAARLCVLMSLLLIIAMPVSSLANATVTYENNIPVKIVLDGFSYETPPASWKLSGSELNGSNMQKVAQHVISDWAPLAYQIFRWGRNEGGEYSGITANIPKGKSWDTYFSESESESWKIILSDWLAASDSKTKGSTQSDYSHRTGIMSTTSLSGLRNAMAEEIRKGLGANHFTVAEVLEEGGGGDKGALHELDDPKNTKVFYNIVTHLNNSSGSIYYYNSYGIAVYDFEMTPIVDPNVEYRDQKRTVDPNGTSKDPDISYTENKSRQESNVAVELWDQTTQTVQNSITNTESISITETIHNEFNFGSDTMFFKDSLQIEVSANQTIETARENSKAIEKQKGGKVTISHNLPPQTGSIVELETRDMTTNTTYTCPVALRYKVVIFSMSGYSSSNYIRGTRSNFSTIFGFGNDEGGYGAPENLNMRAVSGDNNNHISNDSSYGKVHGWYEDHEICNYLDWSWILNRSGMTSLTRKLGTTIPLFGQGANLKVVTEGKYSTIGDVLPLYPLKEVKLERGEEYYKLVTGDSLNVKDLDVSGFNENGVAYFGFDASKGSWVLCDASGKELNSSPTAKLETSGSRITLKALSPGIVYLKYKIAENRYGTLSAPETYAKNSGLKKTAMVEVEVVPLPVNGVTLNDTDLELTVGEAAVLKATVTPGNAANKNVTWSSSKPSIAKVDQDGKVTAAAPGTAKITVTTQEGSKTAVCVVTVNAKTYTVTFVDGQGKTYASRTVKEGEAAVAPSNPKRTGYIFKGWDKDFEYITADMIITARWEKDSEQTQPADPTEPAKDDDQKTKPTEADDQKTKPTKADDHTGSETAVTVNEKVKKIPAVNKLTAEDEARVKEACQAYQSLSKEEKAKLPSGTSTKIDKALKQIKKIQKAEAADKNSVKNRQAEITRRKSDADLAKSTYAPLKVKAGTTTDTSITVSWSKVKGAAGYIVYGNLSGKSNKMKLLGDTSETRLQVKKIGSKKLVKGKNYKFLVLAYKMKSGYKKVAATSNVIHAATTGGSYTNAEKIKPDETKKTLKKGLSWTINATVVKKDSKKSIKKILDLRFESSNKSVAAVSAKGRVTAKKAGKTTIYVYAQNGVCTSVTVTVTKK